MPVHRLLTPRRRTSRLPRMYRACPPRFTKPPFSSAASELELQYRWRRNALTVGGAEFEARLRRRRPRLRRTPATREAVGRRSGGRGLVGREKKTRESGATGDNSYSEPPATRGGSLPRTVCRHRVDAALGQAGQDEAGSAHDSFAPAGISVSRIVASVSLSSVLAARSMPWDTSPLPNFLGARLATTMMRLPIICSGV